MAKDNVTHFGVLLKKRRESRGLSQESLGKVLGVHGQFISNIERGLAPVPTKALRKLVATLSLDEEDVVKILLKDYETKLSRFITKDRSRRAAV